MAADRHRDSDYRREYKRRYFELWRKYPHPEERRKAISHFCIEWKSSHTNQWNMRPNRIDPVVRIEQLFLAEQISTLNLYESLLRYLPPQEALSHVNACRKRFAFPETDLQTLSELSSALA